MNHTVEKNDWIDLTFTAQPPEAGNPFDLEWRVMFTHSSGKTLVLPGFYDGGDSWVVRFSSDLPGEWAYRIVSAHPPLDGQAGRVTVGSNPAPNHRGRVVIDSEDRRKLKYADGDPCFLIGFEADWLALLDFENEGIPNAKKLIKGIAENGFNQVVMNVYAHDIVWEFSEGRGGPNDYGNPPLWPFGGTNDTPDCDTLNPAFFSKLDAVVRELHDNGILCHLMIYVWNKKVNWPEKDSAADRRYFRYVVDRYQACPNIIWDISKEALLYDVCGPEYVLSKCALLRERDSYHNLMTVHDRGFCEQYPDFVDIISTQTWSSGLYREMYDLAQGFPRKPVYNIEHGGYEKCPLTVFPGDYDDAEVCLERNYECIFAGVYSTYYWQGCSWSIVYPDYEEWPRDEQPRLEYFRHMAGFFEKYEYNRLKAVRGLTSSGLVLTDDEGLFLIYKPRGNYAMHSGRLVSGKYSIHWFNIFTGEYSERETCHAEGWMELRSPWGETASIAVVEKG